MIFCRPFVPQFKPNMTSHVLPSAAQAWHMQTSKRWEGLSKSKKSCLICLYLSHVNHMNTGLHSIRSKKKKKQYHNMRPDISTHFFQGGTCCAKICQSTFSVPHWVQLPNILRHSAIVICYTPGDEHGSQSWRFIGSMLMGDL